MAHTAKNTYAFDEFCDAKCLSAVQVKRPHQARKPAEDGPANRQIDVPQRTLVVMSPNIREDGRKEVHVQYRNEIEDIDAIEHR
jgi:hypothetical protein